MRPFIPSCQGDGNADQQELVERSSALLANISLKRLGTSCDVANMAVFLASHESNYAIGTTFFVDGSLIWNYQEH